MESGWWSWLPLSEGELVPQAVASALGVLEQPSRLTHGYAH